MPFPLPPLLRTAAATWAVALALGFVSWSCTPLPPQSDNAESNLESSAQVAAPRTPPSPAQPTAPRTRVFVLGTLHNKHLESELWGLQQLRATIQRIQPDVVCVELADDNLEAALKSWAQNKAVTDARAVRLPEVVQVVFPLMDEMEFSVEAAAQWHRILDAMRRAKVAEFSQLEEYAEQYTAYVAAKAWTSAWLAVQPQGQSDDPFYIHSTEFDLHAKAHAGAYDYFLNDVIGRPMGWTYVHDEHYEKILNTIRKHPGETVLVIFGAQHIYWFHELLRWNPDVELVDVRPYLPGGDSWKLSETELALEEFDAGVDCLRVVWAHFRGDTLYALQRVEQMLALPGNENAALLADLKAAQGLHLSEFLDGPWLGRPEIVAQGEDWWKIRVEVRRFGDQPEDATWLGARLQRDATRPSGFGWTQLELPRWLREFGDTLPR